MTHEPKRTATSQEQEIVRTALLHAPTESFVEQLLSLVSELQVVAYCECGCGSVEFDAPPKSNEQAKPIADGLAKTPKGGDLGIIVWGTASTITGLELYDMGAGDEDKVLPVPSTILPWEAGHAAQPIISPDAAR